jgi:phage baseplate assembly protein W
VEGEAEIMQAIRIILNTAPGERVMHPDFGCRIHEVLFWPANSTTAAIVERHVAQALGQWEPRIRVERVTATPGEVKYSDADRHHLRRRLNELYSDLSADIMEQVIEEIVQRETHGQQAIFIEIDYQIKGSHDNRSLVFPFYLNPTE